MKKWLFFLCIAILIASSQGVGSDAMSTVGAFSLPLRNAGRVTALISANHIQQYAEMTRLQPFYQRNYRNPWLQSNLYQRQLLAERIGNQGRARYGAEHGWIKRLGSTGRGIRQGPDAVYWDPHYGQVHSLEAKGGTSPLNTTYGFLQGTNANSLESARRVLLSRSTTLEEKLQAAYLVKAAQAKKLATDPVRTPHVQGRPGQPRLDGVVDRTDVSRRANEIEQQVRTSTADGKPIFDKAGKNLSRDLAKYRLRVWGLGGLGALGTFALGVQTFDESMSAYDMLREGDDHFRSTLYSVKALTRLTETTALGTISVSAFIPRVASTPFVRIAGKYFLPIVIATEMLSLGTAFYDYGTERINQREYYLRTVGPGFFLTATAGGAVVGGVIGTFIGGGGMLPGTVTGAKLGGLLAIPLSFAGDYCLRWYYRDFDAKRAKALDATIEAHYTIE